MSRYVNQSYFDTVRTLPIVLPQTELKRETSILLASLPLNLGEYMELRSLTLHVIQLLTPGVNPSSEVDAIGAASVSVQLGGMATGAIAVVPIASPGAASLDANKPVVIRAPGVYQVYVRNHSNNVDMSVCVTGSAKIFR